MLAIRRFATVLSYMCVMTARNRVALFFSIALPTFSLLLFGYIFKGNSIPPVGGAGAGGSVSYSVWLLPGILVMNMMATGMMGGSAAMIVWRERGIFRRLIVTGTPVWQVMLARVVSQLALLIVQAASAIILTVWTFGYRFQFGYLGVTLLFIGLGGLVFLAFGQVIASATDRVEVGGVMAQGLYVVLTFLTGVLLPLQILPKATADIATYTPSHMSAELLRAAMLTGGAGSQAALMIGGLTLYFAAALVLSARFFKLVR